MLRNLHRLGQVIEIQSSRRLATTDEERNSVVEMKTLTAASLSRRTLLGAAGGALLAMPLLSSKSSRALAQDAAGGPIHWSLTGVSDLVSLDPAKASNLQDFTVIAILYGGLVKLDENLLVVPSLAAEWSVSDDSLTYTFLLREGITFSDGTPVTADDVVWTFNHALDPTTGGWTGPYYFTLIDGADEMAAGKATEVSGVKKIDDTTVAITIKQPSAYFLSSLSAGPSKILSQAAAADPDNDGKVTSGPFVLKTWNHGQGLDLAPNPSFYEPVTAVTDSTLSSTRTARPDTSSTGRERWTFSAARRTPFRRRVCQRSRIARTSSRRPRSIPAMWHSTT